MLNFTKGVFFFPIDVNFRGLLTCTLTSHTVEVKKQPFLVYL